MLGKSGKPQSVRGAPLSGQVEEPPVQLLGGPFDGLLVRAFKSTIRIPRDHMGIDHSLGKIVAKTIKVYQVTKRTGFYRYVETVVVKTAK